MTPNSKLNELSIVIPIFNEGKNIEKLWIKIKKNINLKKLEIIYVDDNSKDNSHEILKKINSKDKRVKFFIRKSKIKDLSKSCIAGFKISKYKNILVMDGDLQHDPKYIASFIRKFNSTSCDMVVGCRDFSSSKNIGLNYIRKIGSLFLIFLINFLLGKKTSDPMSGFFLFKKKIFFDAKENFYERGYKILADIIYSNKEKIKIIDVKINFKKRIYGKSKISFMILLYLIIFIIRKL